MKTATIILKAACLLAAAAAAGCTSREESSQIYTSYSSYTFAAHESTLRIDVTSNRTWTVEEDADWLEITTTGEDFAILKALANESGEERSTVVTFRADGAEAEVSIGQTAKTYEGKFIDVTDYDTPVFSRNGRFYATYSIEYLSDGMTAITTPIIVDAFTGESRQIEGNSDYLRVAAVSDDGRVVAIDLNNGGMGGTVVEIDGQMHTIEVQGYSSATVSAMSSDGSVMVGYAMDMANWSFVPVRWTDMQPEVLEMPQTNSADQPLSNGAMARGCSGDGSVIYGSEWDYQGLIYWKDGELFFPGKDFAEFKDIISENWWGEKEEMTVICTIQKTAEPYSISENGQYIAATFYDYDINEDKEIVAELNYPVIIDTQSGESHIIKTTNTNAAGITADNNGLCFGGSPAMGITEGFVFDFRSNTVTGMSEWMMSTYGVFIENDRMVVNVSSDSDVISGWKVTESLLGTNYIGWYYIPEYNR